LVLSGFMGSGKSTVGARVAALTGARFVDLDAHIAETQGRPIAAIFEQGREAKSQTLNGEAVFRALERAALADFLAQAGPLVLAVGGGALIAAEGRAAALRRAFVVTLRASVDTILARMGSKSAHPVRPLLAGPDPRASAETLLAARAHAYADCHGELTTDGASSSVDALAVALRAAWLGWR
jgi:shikimate kinase